MQAALLVGFSHALALHSGAAMLRPSCAAASRMLPRHAHSAAVMVSLPFGGGGAAKYARARGRPPPQHSFFFSSRAS